MNLLIESDKCIKTAPDVIWLSANNATSITLLSSQSTLWPLTVHPILSADDDDIRWRNVLVSRSKRLMRSTVATSLSVLLSIVLAIPISVSGLGTQISSVLTDFGVHRSGSQVISLVSYLAGILPQLMMMAIVALAPRAISVCCSFSGELTKTELGLAFQQRLFLYLYLQVFIFMPIAISVSSIMSIIIREPNKIPTLLALNLTKAGDYFISYLVLQGLSLGITSMIDWDFVLCASLRRRFSIQTPRSKAMSQDATPVNWSNLFPSVTILAVIGEWQSY